MILSVKDWFRYHYPQMSNRNYIRGDQLKSLQEKLEECVLYAAHTVCKTHGYKKKSSMYKGLTLNEWRSYSLAENKKHAKFLVNMVKVEIGYSNNNKQKRERQQSCRFYEEAVFAYLAYVNTHSIIYGYIYELVKTKRFFNKLRKVYSVRMRKLDDYFYSENPWKIKGQSWPDMRFRDHADRYTVLFEKAISALKRIVSKKKNKLKLEASLNADVAIFKENFVEKLEDYLSYSYKCSHLDDLNVLYQAIGSPLFLYLIQDYKVHLKGRKNTVLYKSYGIKEVSKKLDKYFEDFLRYMYAYFYFCAQLGDYQLGTQSIIEEYSLIEGGNYYGKINLKRFRKKKRTAFMAYFLGQLSGETETSLEDHFDNIKKHYERKQDMFSKLAHFFFTGENKGIPMKMDPSIFIGGGSMQVVKGAATSFKFLSFVPKISSEVVKKGTTKIFTAGRAAKFYMIYQSKIASFALKQRTFFTTGFSKLGEGLAKRGFTKTGDYIRKLIIGTQNNGIINAYAGQQLDDILGMLRSKASYTQATGKILNLSDEAIGHYKTIGLAIAKKGVEGIALDLKVNGRLHLLTYALIKSGSITGTGAKNLTKYLLKDTKTMVNSLMECASKTKGSIVNSWSDTIEKWRFANRGHQIAQHGSPTYQKMIAQQVKRKYEPLMRNMLNDCSKCMKGGNLEDAHTIIRRLSQMLSNYPQLGTKGLREKLRMYSAELSQKISNEGLRTVKKVKNASSASVPKMQKMQNIKHTNPKITSVTPSDATLTAIEGMKKFHYEFMRINKEMNMKYIQYYGSKFISKADVSQFKKITEALKIIETKGYAAGSKALTEGIKQIELHMAKMKNMNEKLYQILMQDYKNCVGMQRYLTNLSNNLYKTNIINPQVDNIIKELKVLFDAGKYNEWNKLLIKKLKITDPKILEVVKNHSDMIKMTSELAKLRTAASVQQASQKAMKMYSMGGGLAGFFAMSESINFDLWVVKSEPVKKYKVPKLRKAINDINETYRLLWFQIEEHHISQSEAGQMLMGILHYKWKLFEETYKEYTSLVKQYPKESKKFIQARKDAYYKKKHIYTEVAPTPGGF